ATSPLEPRAVLRGDESRQHGAVVERGDGRETSAPDRGDARALRLDPAPRLRIVRAGGQLLLAGTNLQRERALAGLGHELAGVEAPPDRRRGPQPVETARREHDGIEPALATLPQAGVDVSPQRLDRQRGLEREQLSLAPHGGRADAHPGAELARTAQRVARIL